MTTIEIGERLALLNACLNGLSAILIFTGWRFARRHMRSEHRACMIGALASSTLFLASYLTRVALTGTHADPHQGIVHYVYLFVLVTHMILAIVIVPLVLRSAWLAYRDRIVEHRKIARITIPLWLYVSVTGVVVYVMLYAIPV